MKQEVKVNVEFTLNVDKCKQCDNTGFYYSPYFGEDLICEECDSYLPC